MNRPATTWLAFGLGLALVLGSMGYVSLTVLRLDSESAEARQRGALEENVRLALWRMDSAIAPLVGRENARPAHAYLPFYPARRAFTKMFAQLDAGEVQVPSGLLTERHPHVRLHFQFAPGAPLTSPQAPVGNYRDLAESGFASHESIVSATGQLRELTRLLDRDLVGRVVGVDEARVVVAMKPEPQVANLDQSQLAQLRNTFPVQQAMNANEFQARSRTTQQVATIANPPNRKKKPARSEPEAGLMAAVWAGSELMLVRKAEIEGRPVVQGCWLDWPAIRASLLEDVGDLLPEAVLAPFEEQKAEPTRQVRRLAALPVELLPGGLTIQLDRSLSPIQLSLVVAWLFALMAAAAVGAVLRATLALSERRAAFVSAVTHELRTPLTTFRMYTEMLADGMVTDEKKRQEYHQTLHAEADRLDHLVQNVLAYSRLERNSRGGASVPIPLSEVIERIRERLVERVGQESMSLELSADPEVLASRVRVDPEAVGRVLFNLVDNATKYAVGSDDRRVHLEAVLRGSKVLVRVRDHGPGIDARSARQLFRPFSKSAEAAAVSAPGVGLGLALSRRLARKMGGDLVLEQIADQGACFVLTLPVV